MTKEPANIYPIGHKFTVRRSKSRSDDCEVVDILRTYNSAGDLVRFRYVAKRTFLGQTMLDRDVVHVTIAKGTTEQAEISERWSLSEEALKEIDNIDCRPVPYLL